MDKLKADETLDFHNNVIREVAMGEKCPHSDKSSAYILTSPLGHVYTNACPDGLHCVKLYGDTSYDDIQWDTKVDFIRASSFLPSNAHTKQLKKWLVTYFKNPLNCKDIELKFCGLPDYGEFNSKIWMTIYSTCPPGELMSYRELGERSGYGPGASKVVGYAINKNPYMLVVGDHRVIKATGEIWCENDSQRNKLRRLLVKYEISFTEDSFDEALAKVKDRNSATKASRGRRTSVKVKEEVSQPKTRGVKKPARKKTTVAKGRKRTTTRRRRRAVESDEEEEDDDEEDDAEDDA